MILSRKMTFLLCCLIIKSVFAFETTDLVKYKKSIRSSILKNTNIRYYEEGSISEVRRLVDTPKLITNIFEMRDKNYEQARLEKLPWSDDYWPIARGVLGSRYADESFNEKTDWQELFNYVLKREAFDIFDYKESAAIDSLSPSEKYDLLIGKSSVSLTQSMWSQGKSYYDRYGSVESWMGICHGWAPASYMLARPSNMIKVTAHDGKTKINFYPSDIKALSSLLWATTSPPVKFIGSRCNEKDPRVDENGRISSTRCRDVNPAVWHLSVINQLGDLKKSMVIDNTYSYEVWNQPLIGYEYSYFNPKTKQKTKELQEAIIELKDYPEDPYKKYRSGKAYKIIGIYFNIEYGVETQPFQRQIDSERYDRSMKTALKYDLELDQENNIVGGEWYVRDHPDFLWTPMSDSKALTDFDYYLLGKDNWLGESELELNVKDLAQKAAANGRPLAYIVESLIKLSNKK